MYKPTLPLFVAFAFCTAVRAQEPDGLAEIIEKRTALLAKISELVQNQYRAGSATDDQVRTAAFNFYAFRRDSAKTVADRIQWQEHIIAIEREAQASTQKRVEAGIAAFTESLVAEERVLAAEQQLKLLKLQIEKGQAPRQ